jgi:hypothetical protein
MLTPIEDCFGQNFAQGTFNSNLTVQQTLMKNAIALDMMKRLDQKFEQ